MIKAIISKVTIFLFGCLFAFIVGEIVLRGLGYAASDIYTQGEAGLLILNPNEKIHIHSVCFQNDVQTNSLGFHSREYSFERLEGVFRIAVIGDSFVEAMQVPRDKTFTSFLEEKLNSLGNKSYKYEVMPFGISSHGTYRNIMYFEKYAAQFKPDLVIDALAWNDIEDDVYDSGIPVASGGFLKSAKKILRKSVLITTLRQSYLTFRSKLEKDSDELSPTVEILLPEYDDFWQKAWIRQEELLKNFKETAAMNNADFMVVSLTDGYRVHRDLLERFMAATQSKTVDLEKPEKTLSVIAEKNSFPYLALNPLFKKRAAKEEGSTVWPCDGHWNSLGHEWAADALVDYLVSQKLVGD